MSKNHVYDHSDQQKIISKALGERIPRNKIISDIYNDKNSKKLFDKLVPIDQERIVSFLAGEQTLQILYDKFFKKILDPEVVPERMESLISAILGENVKIVKVLPKEGIALTEGGSQVIMDIIIELSDGSTTNVEMQRLGYLFPGERSSCYLSDMMMRQYGKVRDERGKDFSYKDLKNVNLIIIMETSSNEFKAVAPAYIHRRNVTYDSGAAVKNLENVTYISLDTFKEKNDNEISTTLEAWLTFFTAEKPADVLRLLSRYPEFLPMYQDISEFRKSPQEVMGMFSEALQIMDRNTTKYMIDDYEDTISEQKQTISDQSQTISDQSQTISDQSQTISDQSQTIEEQNQIILKLEQDIKELKKKIN